MAHRWSARLVAGSLFMALGLPVAAHHGQAGVFDETRTVELTGTVKQWNFVNPHPVLILEVRNEKGTAEQWDVYFGPSAVSFQRRQGFTPQTFKVGETVIVRGHPATAAGARGVDVWGKAASVKRADGRAVP